MSVIYYGESEYGTTAFIRVNDFVYSVYFSYLMAGASGDVLVSRNSIMVPA